ncbi:MAG: nucleoside diphosphatase [Lasallia pustulata]|uniref:Nucleoside diphosphatase n=1 Tax=Lasallia pustulata TaxID=136370 RepID=A0A5M8PKH9_9LECA|nr:MAG: nucleoside diphosphatase [Lasallia pustulata]
MAKWRYGVILDAGSSGTRVHIYRWLDSTTARKEANAKELESLPVIKTEKKWTKKIHPGVSTFGDKPELVGPGHLKPLFDHALNIVPKDAVADTPIFLLATAGMRLLPGFERKELLAQICSYARSNTKFLLPNCDLHIQVIPGETEGLYGWIAANYLLGGFDSPEQHAHGKGHHTYGFLDMGGASAQIAFAPNATEAERHAEDLKLLRMRMLNGAATEYKVFVTTWLGFGVIEARKRYVTALLEASGSPDTTELPDPCLPVGLTISTKGDVLLAPPKTIKGQEPYLIGTGKFDECLSQTYPLLDKDAPCEDEPCLLHGVHVPAIDFDVNHFVGVSEYWHTTHEVFEMAHKDKAYDFNTYQTRVKKFCSQDWRSISNGLATHEWGKKVDEATAVEVCFKASWLINVLHDGIGIPRIGLESTKGDGYNGTKEVLSHAKEKGFLDPFQAVDKIDDTEVSWTLGKMVLYAASQVQPLDDTLPVGFGSNVAGIPPDFQYAGSKSTPSPAANPSANPDTSDRHDSLFSPSFPRRIPGLLLFLLILSIALFLLLGRDRRARLYHKLASPFHPKHPGPTRSPNKRRTLFTAKLPCFPSRSGPGTYERLLEDGGAEFELADADSDNDHSDESSGSLHAGRTSGWATPRINVGPYEHHGGGSDFFDNAGMGMGQGVGLGLGIGPVGNAMERSGLLARTESKERLAPGGGGGVGRGVRLGLRVRRWRRWRRINCWAGPLGGRRGRELSCHSFSCGRKARL